MPPNNEELDPRVQRTRNLLRNAFIDLVCEQGYHDTTIKDITDRATLNRVTFYLHYDNKDQFLASTIKSLIQELVAKQQLPMENEDGIRSYQQSHQATVNIFEFIAQYSEFFKAMLGEDGVWGFARALQDFHYEATLTRYTAIRGELPETEIDIELLFRHLAASYIGVIQWWLENDMPYSPSEMADKVMIIYREGMYRCLGYQVYEDGFTF